MLTDRYGLELATASGAARDAYVEACNLMLTLYPGVLPGLDRALTEDPDFALAHAARARALQGGGDLAGAQAAAARAEALAAGLPERDVSHIRVFSLLAKGRNAEALDAVRQHVARWPLDALVVSTSANQTGLISMSGRAKREQEQLDFLAALAPHYGTDWWFNGHYAMALGEVGHHAAALPLAERSVADNPRNAAAVHGYAHVLYETGQADETVAFLRPWLADYPRKGGLRGHISWHLSLVLLQQGDVASGFDLFTDAFAAEDYSGPAMVKVMDGPSFLWRSELAGHPRDRARWQTIRDFAYRAFPQPGLPYADWHLALIDAVVGDDTSAAARAEAMDRMVAEERYPAGPHVAALIRGFAAFERKDYAGAIDAIEPVLPERERICGSQAQIDLVEFTLLKAYLSAGRTDDAKRLVDARRVGPKGLPIAGIDAIH